MKAVFGSLAAILVALIIAFVLAVLILPLNFTLIHYSDGQRTGLLNKISKKGLLCKTWEGYMLVGNGNNVNPETFDFTVKDEKIAQQLEANTGKVVTLDYQQYLMTGNCWGDTTYEITGLK